MTTILQLQHEPADILAQVLINNGQVSDPSAGLADNTFNSWPVFAGMEPQVPDDCITLYTTVGRDSGRDHVTGLYLRHRGLQLRLRSSDPKIGFVKIESLRNWLEVSLVRTTATLDSIQYLVHAAANVSDVNALGKESPLSKRCLFTLNFLAAVERLN